VQFTLKAEAFRAAARHRINADMEASDDTRSMLASSIAPEQIMFLDLSAGYALKYSSEEVDCFSVRCMRICQQTGGYVAILDDV